MQVAGAVALAAALLIAAWLVRESRSAAGRAATVPAFPWSPAAERATLPREFVWTGTLTAPWDGAQ